MGLIVNPSGCPTAVAVAAGSLAMLAVRRYDKTRTGPVLRMKLAGVERVAWLQTPSGEVFGVV